MAVTENKPFRIGDSIIRCVSLNSILYEAKHTCSLNMVFGVMEDCREEEM